MKLVKKDIFKHYDSIYHKVSFSLYSFTAESTQDIVKSRLDHIKDMIKASLRDIIYE